MPRGEFLKKPVEVDEILEAIIGIKKTGRGDIMRRIWIFIKKNGLQGKKNKREIEAGKNAEWLAFTGGKKVISMFDIAKLIKKFIKG